MGEEINQLLASKKEACQGILGLSQKQTGMSFYENEAVYEDYMKRREQLIDKIQKIDILLQGRFQAGAKVTPQQTMLENEIQGLICDILRNDDLNKQRLHREMTDVRKKLDQIHRGKKGNHQYLQQGRINTAGAFTDFRK